MFTGLQRRSVPRRSLPVVRAALFTSVSLGAASFAHSQQNSPPAYLQDFESTWQTITTRTPDIFAAGYGNIYTPPPSRAESGNTSVGYDVYNRFDLGTAASPTLYGTSFGLKNMISSIHQMGGSSTIDLVWNHDGFANAGTSGFAAGGGYPGFAMSLQTTNSSSAGYNTQGYNVTDGDFHSAYATGDQEERISGLIDIAQETNNSFIRQPTVAGPDNIPGPTPGATGWNGFALANVPAASNAQFYPSTSGTPQTLVDPTLNQTFTRYNFNTSNPMSGTPVAEDSLGYLMRFSQYMVQVYGADGFRVDAAKNMPEWVMNYLDLATYGASNRTYLNGTKENVFSFSEVYDSSDSLLASYVSKSIYTSGTSVGGNRDVEDYPLYFAMDANLTGTTSNNSWYNVVSASVDCYDAKTGAQDLTPTGTTGVKFVSNQDVAAPSLASVAYAYTLLMPGNAMVYYNGHNFGTEAQRSFPNDGREDALGGVYGTALTTLVDLRNRYGRGNYRQDWLETNNYAFERQGSALVLLSNNTSTAGSTPTSFDSRTIDVTFNPGTPLVELTGNAASSVADPLGVIPTYLLVNADSGSPTKASVNARFLRNSVLTSSGSSVYTGDGYLIYGIPTPTGTLKLTNVSSTLGGAVVASNDSNIAYDNGTALLSTISVIKTSTFQVQLNTVANNIAGFGHYQPADGDSAEIKIDGGVDVANSNGLFTDPTDTVNYGFEHFVTINSPGYYANNGNGSYAQTINTAQLGQGYHYITAEAFTFRNDSGPAVFNDWKQTVYIDLAPPNTTATSFSDAVAGTEKNRILVVTNIDTLANNVHTFLDLPYNMTDSQVLGQISSSTQATQEDTNVWQHSYNNVSSGNHTVTVVSYKPDGTYNIQRFSASQDPFLTTATTIGLGLGDLNFDGSITSSDISSLSAVVSTNNTSFNPAADVNGDGSVDLADVFLLGPILTNNNVVAATWTSYNSYITGSYVTSHTYNVNGTNVIYQDTAGTTNVSSGALLKATYVRGGTLKILAGGSVQIQPNPTESTGVSKVNVFTIAGATNAWTGQFDLTNNSFVLESSNRNSDLARLTNMVSQGYDNGKWDGEGITSSTAASDTSHLHAMAVILNDNGSGSPLFSTFYGQTVDTNAILVSYTLVGDANLDGQVDGSDYSRIDNGFLLQLTGWANGDFNYDGIVNGSDYTLIDNAFNMEGTYGPGPSLTSDPAAIITAQIASGSSVPEPATLAVTALGLSVLSVRRRKGKLFL